MAAPNPEEMELIKELRSRVQDLELDEDLNSDFELLRWIRARENDLGNAELMLRKHIEWREQNQLDEISTWDLPENLRGFLPQGFIGYDDDNCPILLVQVGKWNPKKIVQGTTREDAVKPHWKQYAEIKERMRGRVTRDGVAVTQMCGIVDMDGLSVRQATPQVLRALSDLVQAFEANYPEFLKILILINSPWFVPTFYKVVKPFLSQKTIDKLHFYGYNRDEWMEALRKEFPDSSLPTAYGGNNDIIIS